ncbi:IS3 family transposase [Kiritimatiella glycovorans]|uniref:IS3 family transposase n=1 Tax=Kiritimatiella glycovorans TaxID=1307763 RepID=UPI000BBA00CA|nr:IS3 family transposase [Kiritimatiella glycovorans]
MKKPRRNHSAQFKARIAMEALRGIKTVAEIAAENNVHPTMVTRWKTELTEGAADLFERKNAPDLEKRGLEKNCERLERKVGQLVIEKEWMEKKCRVGDRSVRKALVDPSDAQRSLRRQCALLGVNRNRLTPPEPRATITDLRIMRMLDELHLRFPTFGTRGLRRLLKREQGLNVGRKRLRRLMRLAHISALRPRPRTSAPGKGHRIYPYLLRGVDVTRPNQVWCADITYIPMPRGYCYLVAVMDWYSRKVLGWELSTTMDTAFCLRAFRSAVATAGRAPEIMNTDQGSQFTSTDWIREMKQHEGLKISMDGTGRWVDNVFIERLWWSLKYEDVYLKSYETPRETGRGVGAWLERYNTERPHSSIGDRTPDEAYFGIEAESKWRAA